MLPGSQDSDTAEQPTSKLGAAHSSGGQLGNQESTKPVETLNPPVLQVSGSQAVVVGASSQQPSHPSQSTHTQVQTGEDRQTDRTGQQITTEQSPCSGDEQHQQSCKDGDAAAPAVSQAATSEAVSSAAVVELPPCNTQPPMSAIHPRGNPSLPIGLGLPSLEPPHLPHRLLRQPRRLWAARVMGAPPLAMPPPVVPTPMLAVLHPPRAPAPTGPWWPPTMMPVGQWVQPPLWQLPTTFHPPALSPHIAGLQVPHSIPGTAAGPPPPQARTWEVPPPSIRPAKRGSADLTATDQLPPVALDVNAKRLRVHSQLELNTHQPHALMQPQPPAPEQASQPQQETLLSPQSGQDHKSSVTAGSLWGLGAAHVQQPRPSQSGSHPVPSSPFPLLPPGLRSGSPTAKPHVTPQASLQSGLPVAVPHHQRLFSEDMPIPEAPFLPEAGQQALPMDRMALPATTHIAVKHETGQVMHGVDIWPTEAPGGTAAQGRGSQTPQLALPTSLGGSGGADRRGSGDNLARSEVPNVSGVPHVSGVTTVAGALAGEAAIAAGENPEADSSLLLGMAAQLTRGKELALQHSGRLVALLMDGGPRGKELVSQVTPSLEQALRVMQVGTSSLGLPAASQAFPAAAAVAAAAAAVPPPPRIERQSPTQRAATEPSSRVPQQPHAQIGRVQPEGQFAEEERDSGDGGLQHRSASWPDPKPRPHDQSHRGP